MGIRQRIAGRKRLLELFVELGLFGPMTRSPHAVIVPLILLRRALSQRPSVSGRTQWRAAGRSIPSPRQNATGTALLGEGPGDHQTAEREAYGHAERKAEPAPCAAIANSACMLHARMLTRVPQLAQAGLNPADVSTL